MDAIGGTPLKDGSLDPFEDTSRECHEILQTSRLLEAVVGAHLLRTEEVTWSQINLSEQLLLLAGTSIQSTSEVESSRAHKPLPRDRVTKHPKAESMLPHLTSLGSYMSLYPRMYGHISTLHDFWETRPQDPSSRHLNFPPSHSLQS